MHHQRIELHVTKLDEAEHTSGLVHITLSDKNLIIFERTNLHFYIQQITVCGIFMTLE